METTRPGKISKALEEMLRIQSQVEGHSLSPLQTRTEYKTTFPDSPQRPPRPASPPKVPRFGSLTTVTKTDPIFYLSPQSDIVPKSPESPKRYEPTLPDQSAFDYGTGSNWDSREFNQVAEKPLKVCVKTISNMYQKQVYPFVVRSNKLLRKVREAKEAYLKQYRKRCNRLKREQRKDQRRTAASESARPFLSGGTKESKHSSQIKTQSTYRSWKGEANAQPTHHDKILLSQTKVEWQKSLQRFVLYVLHTFVTARKLRAKWSRQAQNAKNMPLVHFVLSSWIHHVKVRIEKKELETISRNSILTFKMRRALYALYDVGTEDVRSQIWLIKAFNVLGMRKAKRIIHAWRFRNLQKTRKTIMSSMSKKYLVERTRVTVFSAWKAQIRIDALLQARVKSIEIIEMASKASIMEQYHESVWMHMTGIINQLPFDYISELQSQIVGLLEGYDFNDDNFYGAFRDVKHAITYYTHLGEHRTQLQLSRKDICARPMVNLSDPGADQEVQKIHSAWAETQNRGIPAEMRKPATSDLNDTSSIVPLDVALLNPRHSPEPERSSPEFARQAVQPSVSPDEVLYSYQPTPTLRETLTNTTYYEQKFLFGDIPSTNLEDLNILANAILRHVHELRDIGFEFHQDRARKVIGNLDCDISELVYNKYVFRNLSQKFNQWKIRYLKRWLTPITQQILLTSKARRILQRLREQSVANTRRELDVTNRHNSSLKHKIFQTVKNFSNLRNRYYSRKLCDKAITAWISFLHIRANKLSKQIESHRFYQLTLKRKAISTLLKFAQISINQEAYNRKVTITRWFRFWIRKLASRIILRKVIGNAVESRKGTSNFTLLSKIVTAWRDLCELRESTAVWRLKVITANRFYATNLKVKTFFAWVRTSSTQKGFWKLDLLQTFTGVKFSFLKWKRESQKSNPEDRKMLYLYRENLQRRVFEAWWEQLLEEKVVRQANTHRIFKHWKRIHTRAHKKQPRNVRESYLVRQVFSSFSSYVKVQQKFYNAVERKIYRTKRNVFWALLENILARQKQYEDVKLAKDKYRHNLVWTYMQGWKSAHQLRGKLAYAERWYRNRNKSRGAADLLYRYLHAWKIYRLRRINQQRMLTKYFAYRKRKVQQKVFRLWAGKENWRGSKTVRFHLPTPQKKNSNKRRRTLKPKKIKNNF